MSRLFRVRTALAALIAAAALFSCGCSELGSALENASGLSTSAPTEAIPTEQAPEPTVFEARNGVFDLFTDFFKVFASASDGLFEAVYDSEDGALRTGYLSLMRDEALLSKLYSSVGILTVEGESGLFADTLTGPYAGSGYYRSDGSFEYDFDSGDRLTGSIADGTLSAKLGSEVSETMLRVARTENGFFFRIDSAGSSCVCELRQGSVRYVSCGAGLLEGLPDDTFPEIGGVLEFSSGEAHITE